MRMDLVIKEIQLKSRVEFVVEREQLGAIISR